MTLYTQDQKYSHLKTWASSGLSVEDYCLSAGISCNSIKRWAKRVLADDHMSSLRDKNQKKILLRKIAELESGTVQPQSRALSASSTSLVMVSRSNTAPIAVEYMGARILIGESSIEPVLRAIKTVSGSSL